MLQSLDLMISLKRARNFHLSTSVRHPTFTLGYHAVLSLLDKIAGKYTGEISARVPTQLVIRQSCGCRLESAPIAPGVSRPSTIKMNKEVLSHLMAERTFIEIRHSPREEIESLCSDLLQGYIESLSSPCFLNRSTPR